MGFKTRRFPEERFAMSKGAEIWKIDYPGDRAFQTWEGQNADFGPASKHNFESAGQAKAVVDEQLRIKENAKYEFMDLDRLVPSIPNTQYCSALSLNAFLEASKSKAPAKWHKDLKNISYLHEQGVFLYEGNLKTASLRIGPNPLVVRGDLQVDDLLSDGSDADETLLVVLGDLDVGNLATSSSIFVAGNARVRSVLYGSSAHDHMFAVGGKLSAHVVIDGDHWFNVYGGGSVAILVGEPRCFLQPVNIASVVNEPHLVLRDNAMEADGMCFDRYEVWRLLACGAELLL